MKNLTNERLKEIIAHRSPSLRWGEAEAMASELLVLRPGEAPAVTPDSAPSFILDLMAQIRAAKSPEEVRAIKAKVCAADLDVAVETFDKAIEKLSNL